MIVDKTDYTWFRTFETSIFSIHFDKVSISNYRQHFQQKKTGPKDSWKISMNAKKKKNLPCLKKINFRISKKKWMALKIF